MGTQHRDTGAARLPVRILAVLLALSSALAPVARPVAAQPAGFVCDGAPGVYLYDGLAYSGRCLRLVSDVADLSSLGFNDLASSIRLVGAWSATVYAGQEYEGAASTFVDDDRNLIDTAVGDNEASAVQVRHAGAPAGFRCDGSEGVYLYDLPGYSGRCLRFITPIPHLGALDFDNAAASIAFIGPWRATLYQQQNYRYSGTTLTANAPDLAATEIGNDRASSLTVERSPLAPRPPEFVCDGGPGVYLYEHPDYSGDCLRVGASASDLRIYGFDDLASALRVVGSYEVVLHRDPDFTGVEDVFVGDDPDLADNLVGDNLVTSITVRAVLSPSPLACDGEPGVYLYEDPGYGGRCLKFTSDIPDLRIHGFDDQISSLRAVGGYGATLYRDLSYTGVATAFPGDDPSLADDAVGDDHATSAQVTRGDLPSSFFCEGQGVYLYQDPDYGGRCLKFISDIPDLRIYGFDDLASSLRVVGPYEVALYRDLAFRGDYSIFPGDDPNLADDIVGDNQASSFQIRDE